MALADRLESLLSRPDPATASAPPVAGSGLRPNPPEGGGRPDPEGSRSVATDYSPATVHIAIGVLMEQRDCDAPGAIAVLASSARTAGRSLTDLAYEIIDDHHQRLVTGDQGAG